jgi:hypothetical protein
VPMPKWAKMRKIVKSINGCISQTTSLILPISEVSVERKSCYLFSGTADGCPRKDCF